MSLLVLVTFTSFSCTLSGMFVHDSSKRFIQRPILIVLNVYMTLVAGSLPTLQMCFSSIRTHVSVSKGSIHTSCGTFKHKIVTKHLFETSQSLTYALNLWNRSNRNRERKENASYLQTANGEQDNRNS